MADLISPAGTALLEKLLLGQLPPAEAERFAAEFADNQKLEPLARALAADNAMLDALQKRPPAKESARDSLAEKLVRRLSAAVSRRAETVVLPAEAADDGPAASLAETVAPGGGGDDESEPMPATLEYFRIEKVLGEGGMGTVYLAEDTRLGRKVAVKTLKKEIAKKAGAKDRFFREARAAAKLEHDHIIPIHYVGESQGVPFLAMPFLKGWPLDAHLKKAKGLLPTAEVLRIGREVALGLAAAHEAGLIHRDIKPANIWLEAPHGRVKILDFGLARSQSEEGNLTASGAVMGTPAYMAPEQARGKPVDARADLFSLGVMLYELATGKKPFTGPDMMSILTSLALDDPAKANEVNPAVPAKLADLISRLMAKEPGRRPMSANVVADELMHLTMQTTRPTFEVLPEMPAATSPAPAAADPWGGIEETELPSVVAHGPKAQAKPKIHTPPKAQAKPATAKRGPNKWLLPIASLLGLIVVTAAVIVIVRDKDGKKVAEVVVPDGGKVEVIDGSKPPPEKAAEFKPLPAVELPATSPFDQLDPAKIPAAEKGPWLPPSAVAVIGARAGKHTMPITALDATPDGKLVAAVSASGELRLTDVAAGKDVAVVALPDATGRVAITADGKKLAVLCADKLRLFTHAAGAVAPAGELNGKWTAFARTADGSRAVVTLGNGRAQLWDLAEKPKQLAETAEAHDGAAACPVFLRGGEWFATSGADKIVRVWESATGKKLHQFGPYDNVRTLHAVRAGKELVVVTEWNKFHRWSFDGPAPAERTVTLALETPAYDSSVDADGRTIAVFLSRVGGAVEVKSLDGKATEASFVTAGVNQAPVWLSPDGKRLAFGHFWTQSVGVADLGAGEAPRLVVPGVRHTTPVAVTAAGDVLALATDGVRMPEGTWLTVKDGAFAPREPGKRFPLPPFSADRVLAALAPGSRRVYAVAVDGVNYDAYDLAAQPDSQPARKFAAGSILHMAAMSADESAHAVIDSSSSLVVLKRTRGAELTEYARLPVSPMGVARVRVAPDGRAVYALDAVRHGVWRLRAWDLTGPKPREVKTPPEWAELQAFDLSADGRRLATYDFKSVTTWDTAGPAPKLVRRRDGAGVLGFYELLFSPDGRYLLFGGVAGGESQKCQYRVSDTADDAVALSFTLPFPVTRLQFTPESRHIIAAVGNGTACVLRVAKPADPATERRLAMHAIALGGAAGLDGNHFYPVKAANQLPKTPFKLTFLYLSGRTAVTDADLAPFKDCKNLTMLDLWATKVTDAGLDYFKDCKDITDLHLESTVVTDAGMAKLRAYGNLAVLGLERAPITDAGLETLKAFPRLTQLSLDGCANITDAGVRRLKAVPGLTSLVLNNTGVTDAAMADVAGFKTLTSLGLSGLPVTDEGLGRITAGLSNLTLLTLDKTKVTAKGVADAAKKLPQCRIAWAGGLVEPPAPVDADRQAAEFVLANGGRVSVSEPGLVRDPPKLPAGPFRLTAVGFENNRNLTNGQMACFRGCKHLTSLTLFHTSVGDEGLAYFADGQKLRTVCLNGSMVTDAGLVHLRGCTELTNLDFRATKIGDAGLAHFRDCPNLEALDLWGTPVTDAGLALFHDRKSLRSVHVQKTKVTATGVEAFRKALPDCRIDWDGGVIEPAAGSAADRKAAEYVLSVGGFLKVDGLEKHIKEPAELPKGDIRLVFVSLWKKQAKDAALAVFKDCRHLKEIDLSHTQVTDAGLAHFKDCLTQTHLNLSATAVTAAGLAHFKDCKKLTLLHLYFTGTTDAGLAAFGECKRLTAINLHGTQVTDAGLATFKGCEDLETLLLGATAVTDAGLALFKDCKNLVKLELTKCAQVTDAGLAHLKACKHLATLGLAETAVTDAGLSNLAGLDKLKELVLTQTKVTAKGVAGLAKALPACTITWDGGIVKPSAVGGDADRKGAEYALSVGGIVRVNGTTTDLRAVANLPAGAFQLTEVNLERGNQVSDDGIANLAGCNHLNVVYLNKAPLTDKGIVHLAGLSNLRKLSLADVPVSDAGLAVFKDCNQLTHLYLNNTKVTNTGVALFKDCANLDVLSVPGTTATAPGLAWFKNREKLTHLVLADTPAGDAETELCKSLPGLKLLSFTNTQLTDKGVDHLKACDKLVNLLLKKTKVSPAKINELTMALPNCKIEWDGGVIEPAKK